MPGCGRSSSRCCRRRADGGKSAQIPFNIRDGRIRVGATTLEAEGARVVVSGGYDIPADQADIRANLALTAAGRGQPAEIQLFAAGSPDALDRTVDVAALSSWLAVRAIDRETRRLEAIERGEPPTHAPPQPSGEGSDPPVSSIPLPDRDPREGPARPKAPPRPAVSQTREPVATGQAAPLPPPITVRPAPGDAKPRLHPPLVLTPPANPRAAF